MKVNILVILRTWVDVDGADGTNEKRPEFPPALFRFPSILAGSGGGDLGGVDLDARAHRRAERDLADILALGARRLGLDDRVDQRVEIRAQVCGREARLADAAWMMPAFSTRNSTWPPLAALTASATFIVTVPSFGFGIRPLGPSTLPRRPTMPIMSGVAMQRSKSIVPPWTISIRSSAPTTSAPASRGLVGLGALGEHADADRLAGALGQGDDAADHLVGVARIDAQVQRDLDRLVELGGGVGLHQRDRLIDAVQLLAVDRRWRGSSPSCSALP